MWESLGWGALAASSLLVGALIGLARPWPRRLVGLVLGFGAGALISAVSFELAEEGVDVGGATAVAIGLAVGALTYYAASGVLASRSRGSDTGSALALGAFLDGIPEQLVLGIGLAGGGGVSVSLLAAIYVSNLPEGVGGASDMHRAGRARSGVLREVLAFRDEGALGEHPTRGLGGLRGDRQAVHCRAGVLHRERHLAGLDSAARRTAPTSV